MESERLNIQYADPSRITSTADKLAVIYDIPVAELLDDYNLFLYRNQGEQIRAMRPTLGLSQSAYAKMLGVPLGTLKNWEQNRVRVFKSTWKKHFNIN